MINHISLGVADIAAAGRFYDAVLKPLGYGRDAVALWISAAERPVPADPASGLHVCFDAPSRQAVDAFHAAAVAAGGADNGAPGLRAEYGPDYYAAFAVDPDGYRIEAWCGAPA